MTRKVIAIDAMSGDFGPSVIIPSCIQFLKNNSKISLCVVGDSLQIEPLIPRVYAPRIDVIHTSQVVTMDDKPAQALRLKKQSSMHLSVDLVKSGEACACVSAGNTGALMAISKTKIKMIPGISRPAIFGLVPSAEGHSYLLDMGANVDCDAKQLLEFAWMGTLVSRALDGIDAPKVALLNNGEEEIKGNSQVKQAAELFSTNNEINYIGFIEGHNLYRAMADIIVCDGFVGNVAVKASEGVAKFIFDIFQKEVRSNFLLSPLFWLMIKMTRQASKKIDPRYLNGASFLGLKGVVVKSHGHADELAFCYALNHAQKMINFNIIERLESVASFKEKLSKNM